MKDRFLPDKAIDVIDEAGARTRVHRTSLPPELTLYPGHGRCGMTLGEGLADIRW